MAASKEGQMQKAFVQDDVTSIQYMGKAFHVGQREQFFMLWNRFVPMSLRSGDVISQKLEFYLRIYFAVYHSFMGQGPNGN